LFDKAKSTLDNLTEENGSGFPDNAYFQIALEEAEKGRFIDAKSSAKRIQDTGISSRCLERVCVIETLAQDSEQAINFVKKIKDTDHRDEDYIEILKSLLGYRKFDEAKKY